MKRKKNKKLEERLNAMTTDTSHFSIVHDHNYYCVPTNEPSSNQHRNSNICNVTHPVPSTSFNSHYIQETNQQMLTNTLDIIHVTNDIVEQIAANHGDNNISVNNIQVDANNFNELVIPDHSSDMGVTLYFCDCFLIYLNCV